MTGISIGAAAHTAAQSKVSFAVASLSDHVARDSNDVIEAAADTEAPAVMGVSVVAAAHTTAQSKVNTAVASDP